MTENNWEAAQQTARAQQDAVRIALGHDYWEEGLPLPGHQPPHWTNRALSFDPDRRFQAITSMWLIEMGVHGIVQALAGTVAPAVKALADTTCEDMAWTNDFRKAAGDDWDPSMPFFSEATLYPLVGKEMARTILARLAAVTQAGGAA